MENLNIKIVKTAPIDQLIELYKDAGWWCDENDSADPQFIQKIIEGSFCFVVAFLEDKIIGMGRAISDSVSDAYIQDVVVLNEFRGQQIGVLIMDTIIAYLKANGISWIGLISEPKAVSFYQRYGFKEMKDYVPFKLEEGQ
ncbi:MAG: GNAT family N-acetyltransferase [Candidatus Cloacimonetes bacterium]|nr:GNAT family N-acetyltransferase [Candidatus Cloacimonadota bacterium]